MVRGVQAERNFLLATCTANYLIPADFAVEVGSIPLVVVKYLFISNRLFRNSAWREMRTFLSQSRALFIHSSNHNHPKYVHNRSWGTDRWAIRWRNLNAMATLATKQALHTFVIWAPDYTDEGAFSRRLSVREQHLANLKARAGFVTVGYFSHH
jgi:hypothetical protein